MDITLVELDLVTIINEMFLGYIERKNSGLLYGRADDLPKKLIKLYYRLDPSDRHLDELKVNLNGMDLKKCMIIYILMR